MKITKSDKFLIVLLGLFLIRLAVQWLVGGFDQLLLYLRINNYEIIAGFIFIAAYLGVRRLNCSASPQHSFMAIFSAMNAILNPSIINYLSWHLNSPFAVGIGSSELRSFSSGLLSLVCGIVALVRIQRSQKALRGMPFALFGIIGGLAWVIFWGQLYIRFVGGMNF